MSNFGDLEQNQTIEGASDGTPIGNVEDKLKTSCDANILAGLSFNKVTGEYPSNSVEVFKYYFGLTLLSTITCTYSSSSKKDILSLVRVDEP